jgi:hypothetical protein
MSYRFLCGGVPACIDDVKREFIEELRKNKSELIDYDDTFGILVWVGLACTAAGTFNQEIFDTVVRFEADYDKAILLDFIDKRYKFISWRGGLK